MENIPDSVEHFTIFSLFFVTKHVYCDNHFRCVMVTSISSYSVVNSSLKLACSSISQLFAVNKIVNIINTSIGKMFQLLYKKIIILDIHECESSPCQNGGVCFEYGAHPGYYCSCQPGFNGTNCEEGVLIYLLIYFFVYVDLRVKWIFSYQNKDK